METAMVLGGTAPHIELIENLKNRGYHVILVDYFDNPPAAKVADEHLKISTLDYDAVLNAAKECKASLVISTCIDQANVTACYVAEKLGLPHPYSFETALDVTDKGKMKKKMLDNGISTARYAAVSCIEDINKLELKLPLMVKPADCCGSAGVKKAVTEEELKQYLKEALSLSRTHQAIVEEFIDGFEVSVYSFIENGKAKLLLTSQRFSITDGDQKVIKCFSSIAPADLPERALKNAQKALDDIARVFKLDNTPLFFQAMISDTNDVKVIEFAPRIGGGLCFRTIKEITGFDIIDASVDSFLEIKVHVEDFIPKCYYLTHQLYASDGIFSHVCGVEEMKNNGVIEEIHYHKTKGMHVSSEKAGSSRVAAFLSKADNKNDLIKFAATAIDKMDVIDNNGKSIMRKDIFLKHTR